MHIPEFDKKITIEEMSNEQRLELIADVIERVDNRCMASDTVTPTLQEMRQEEISEIYALAKGKSEYLKRE